MRASRAIAGYVGGVLAVDILEHPERGPLVGEVNYAVEFRETEDATGADIAGRDRGLRALRRAAWGASRGGERHVSEHDAHRG